MDFRNRIRHSLLLFIVSSFVLRVHCTERRVEREEGSSCYAPKLILKSTIPESAHHGNRVIIAHRGASSHLPEHSLEAYRLALELGADYIEPDLVATSDGVLIAIHSMDLNITTDVALKFPDRTSFSSYLNRTGYWSYDFTLEEIKTLRIRQRLPTARSKGYDGLFSIPTFTEILQLTNEWNTQIEPLRVKYSDTDHIQRIKRGVYAEIKDYPWLLQDNGMDLVDLIFKHIHANKELWTEAIFPNMCSLKRPKLHDYSIPPLVIQSFEGSALESFAQKWKSDEVVSSFAIKDANATTPVELPSPPLVLLVNHQDCLEDNFWFQVQDHWREFLAGIGPNKMCLTPPTRHWRDFMDRAEMLDLAVHPWAERPELEFFLANDENNSNEKPSEESSLEFPTVLDEMIYLFCTVGVHGIFSESIDAAVLANSLPCPDETMSTTAPSSSKNNSKFTGETKCKETGNDVLVGMVSFVTGLMLSIIFSRMPNCRKREQLPTTEEDVVDGIDLTDEDREML